MKILEYLLLTNKCNIITGHKMFVQSFSKTNFQYKVEIVIEKETSYHFQNNCQAAIKYFLTIYLYYGDHGPGNNLGIDLDTSAPFNSDHIDSFMEPIKQKLLRLEYKRIPFITGTNARNKKKRKKYTKKCKHLDNIFMVSAGTSVLIGGACRSPICSNSKKREF